MNYFELVDDQKDYTNAISWKAHTICTELLNINWMPVMKGKMYLHLATRYNIECGECDLENHVVFTPPVQKHTVKGIAKRSLPDLSHLNTFLQVAIMQYCAFVLPNEWSLV